MKYNLCISDDSDLEVIEDLLTSRGAIVVTSSSYRFSVEIYKKMLNKLDVVKNKYTVDHCRIETKDQDIVFLPINYDGNRILGYRPKTILFNRFNTMDKESRNTFMYGLTSLGQDITLKFYSDGVDEELLTWLQ